MNTNQNSEPTVTKYYASRVGRVCSVKVPVSQMAVGSTVLYATVEEAEANL